MVKALNIKHEGMQYGVELYGNEIVFYRVEKDESGFAAWGTDDDIWYNYSITGDVNNSVALYRKIAEAVQSIIYSEGKHYYTFNVSDEKRGAIYERFAEKLSGYRAVHASDYFYLYKE